MSTSNVWDRDDLEPDRDPETGSFVPCVWCGMSGQVGGTGVCSPECEDELMEYYGALRESPDTPCLDGVYKVSYD